MSEITNSEVSKIGPGEMYCPTCGNTILKLAEICPKCGVRNTLSTNTVQPKSKTAAVLLAVFLGFWTWLYTYIKRLLEILAKFIFSNIFTWILGYHRMGLGNNRCIG